MGRTGRERHDTGGLANFQQVGGEITMGDIVLQQTYEFGSGCDGCHSLLFARVRPAAHSARYRQTSRALSGQPFEEGYGSCQALGRRCHLIAHLARPSGAS